MDNKEEQNQEVHSVEDQVASGSGQHPGNEHQHQQQTPSDTIKNHVQPSTGPSDDVNQPSTSSGVGDDASSKCCNATLKTSPKNTRYSCTICNRDYTRRGYLRIHNRMHNGARPHKCSLCNTSFARKPSLDYHLRLHKAGKLFFCKYCNCGFSLFTRLTDHERKHENIKLL